MKKTSAALLAVPLAASMLLLSGCGDNSKPTASRSNPTSSSPPTTVSANTTTSPTFTTQTTDPNIPAAARAHTTAGAEAFVRYFYSQLNIAWSKPRAGLISSLSETSCKTCANFEREAAKSVLRNERVVGQSMILTTVNTSDATNPARLTVLAIGYQPNSLVVDATGRTVQTLQREPVRSLITLHWTAAWSVSEIQRVS